jgi:flagellar basal body-associated protein FliL
MPAQPPEKNDVTAGENPAAPPSSGIKGWLPLILTMVFMPVLAYLMTTFVLLPKLQHSLGSQTVQARETSSESGSSAEKVAGKESGKPKIKVPLSKVIVNVSGSLGTRMLLASFTLAGSSGDFKTKIEENNDQLRDLASSTLGSKTIADLEKPEARNLIRAELLSQFNSALGGNPVQEIYITEFAIQ